ncbi:MAG TPA: hypothetical protein VFS30_17805, partial [Dehalococcoidia bacterium]|nr:hypothetical protein [Dehalococcoidia bacterium]
MAIAETVGGVEPVALPAWNSARQTLRATALLASREIRLAVRTPMYLLPNLVVPIFFYFIMLGSLKGFANAAG